MSPSNPNMFVAVGPGAIPLTTIEFFINFFPKPFVNPTMPHFEYIYGVITGLLPDEEEIFNILPFFYFLSKN